MIGDAPKTFASHYVLIPPSHKGGTADVYRAIDTTTGETVAVKILKLDLSDRMSNLLFAREADAQERLAARNHPNIVRAKEIGRDTETGRPYFVFEWIPKDLDQALRENPPEGWDDFATSYAVPLFEALACAHNEGVLHRDIKPNNVLVTADGTPKLSDFGIAKLEHDVQPGQTLVGLGAKAFVPQNTGNYEHRFTRDVYALGVLSLMAITGIDPFDTKYDDAPRAPTEDALKAADVPPEVLEFLRCCTSEDPEDRPITGSAALADLLQIQAKRSAGWLSRQLFHLALTPKVLLQMQAVLDLSSLSEVTRLLEEDLDGDVGVRSARDNGNVPRPGQLHLLGEELEVHVGLHQVTKDRLHVFSAFRPPSYLLERLREQAYRLPMRVKAGAPTDPADERARLLELLDNVALHEANVAVAERERERRRLFGVWKRLLDAMTDIEQANEDPLPYGAFSREGKNILFRLEGAISNDLLNKPRRAELLQGGFLAGDVLQVRPDNSLLLSVKYGEPERLPRKGILRIDNFPSRINISRQDAAVDALLFSRAARPDLPELLLEPGKSRLPVPDECDEFFEPELDQAKRDAIKAALGAPDFLIVEGPPGTGKTTFITELVLQALRKDPTCRILVTSQTHAALDNVLEQLARFAPNRRMVRIARHNDSHVSPKVWPYLLAAQKSQWKDQAVKAGRSFLRSWAQQRGISDRGVLVASLYEELASVLKSLKALDARRRQAEVEIHESSTDSATSTSERATLLELEIAAIRADRETVANDRYEIVERLRQLGETFGLKELDGITPEELDGRAADSVDRQHPAYGDCLRLARLLAEWHVRFGLGDEFDAAVIARAEIVAATCVGLPSLRGVDAIKFDLCIVDEASKATATEALVPLVNSKRWVLVGDQRQLPPFVDDALVQTETLKAHDLTEDDVRETLFDRLAANLPPECRTRLSTQHRMVPAIGNLISECFYGGTLRSVDKPVPEWTQLIFGRPVTWFTTSDHDNRQEASSGVSRVNQLEARLIRILLGRVNAAASWAKVDQRVKVAVISAYLAQSLQIQRELASQIEEWVHLDVECSTVDAYQGREAEIVFYSITRSNRIGEVGFLRDISRLNVALSRARFGLAIVGDHLFCASAGPSADPLRSVLRYIEGHPMDCAITKVEL